jgi:hypothetical protein
MSYLLLNLLIFSIKIKMMIIALFFLFFGHIFSMNKLNENMAEEKKHNILPFTSLKMKEDLIYMTLDKERHEWHKLLSIDNIGYDAIVNFSKQHYGQSKCDYELECYKYNIIANFDQLYQLMQGKPLLNRLGIEFEFENKIQNGIDVESTIEKYEINQKFLADNIKQTKAVKLIFPELNIFGQNIFKGLNKMKKVFQNIFDEDSKSGSSPKDYKNDESI